MIDRQQYIDVLRSAGEFAHGGHPEFAAVEWMAEGFSPLETQKWLDVFCYDPRKAGQLAEAGVIPEQVGLPYGNKTVGYAVAKGNLTIEKALDYLSLREASAVLGRRDRLVNGRKLSNKS